MPEQSHQIPEQRPLLSRDRSFWGMTATQFLGAFNDNLFKQLILLWCLSLPGRENADYQGIAGALFALPFVLFSGVAGYLADRNSKRGIVVLCKVGEIVIMALGMLAFALGHVPVVFVVLFLMGTQSAFFGPSKYGILPEMVRGRDLPAANGIIQMTTFLAIIFGTASAGFLKDAFPASLWIVCGWCVIIAIAGTVTSLWVRRTPIAHPGLPFRSSFLAIGRPTWLLLRRDRSLFGVLMIVALFWFLGGLVQPTVNAMGKEQLDLADRQTSLLVACLGVGLAIGCALAGRISAGKVKFRLVRVGAVGMAGCFLLLGLMKHLSLPSHLASWLTGTSLVTLGIFAGLFAVPLQVFLQARPPEDQKGRIIGAMNLLNFIGIFLASAFYHVGQQLVIKPLGLPPGQLFFAPAGAMLLVALFYRPQDADLGSTSE